MPIRRRNAAALAIALFVVFATISSGNIALTQPEVDPFAESLEQAQSIKNDYPLLLNPPPQFNCPCTLRQLEQHPNRWEQDLDFLPTYHPGAVDAYRSTGTWSSGGKQHGQQCTYNGTGPNARLITAGAAAGTPDIVSPEVNLTPLEHAELDVVPFERLGWRIYTEFWRPNNGNRCPATTVPIIHLRPGGNRIQRLPNAQVGVDYAQRLSTTRGVHPFTFELTGAFLPAFEPDDTVMPDGLDLQLGTGGWRISGTPTSDAANQTFTFTIRATAANGLTGMQVYRIFVEEAEVPNLIGTWNGFLYQNSGSGTPAGTFTYRFTILNQQGNTVTGRTRSSIVVAGRTEYVLKSISGTITGNILSFRDVTILEQTPGPGGRGWCMIQGQLTLNGNNRLAGPWTGQTNCSPGTIEVSR